MKLPVVYTMGKVASSSVTDAIARSGRRCHDIHTLSMRHILKLAQDRLTKDQYPTAHVCVTMAWHREITDTGRCIYISLVRDPIARNLSAHFQNIPVSGGRHADVSLKAAKAIVEAFRANYPHRFPTSWFDREFKRYLGVDVYSVPFDKVRRRVLTEQFVVMRTDLDDADKSRLLSRVLGCEIDIERMNVGVKKSYARTYQAAQEAAKFPADFVEKIYSTNFARHFWTEDELDAFRRRWTAPSNKTFATVRRLFSNPVA